MAPKVAKKTTRTSKSSGDGTTADQRKSTSFSSRPDYKELPILSKVKLIQEFESGGVTQTALSKKYGVALSTVNQIVRLKERYLREYERMKLVAGNEDKMDEDLYCSKKMRIKKSPVDCVNQVLEEFIEAARIHKWELSGPKLQKRAKMIASQFGIKDFRASNGWLQRFKTRCPVEFTPITPKRKKVDNVKTMCELTPVSVNPFPAQFPPECMYYPNGYPNQAFPTLPHPPPPPVLNQEPAPVPISHHQEPTLEPDDDELTFTNHLIEKYQARMSEAAGGDSANGFVSVEMTEGEPTTSTKGAKGELDKKGLAQSKRKTAATNRTAKGGRKGQNQRRTRQASFSSEHEDKGLAVPHIAQVRDAVDTLERFSLAMVPDLLPSVMGLRQEIGNFIIRQQSQSKTLPITTDTTS